MIQLRVSVFMIPSISRWRSTNGKSLPKEQLSQYHFVSLFFTPLSQLWSFSIKISSIYTGKFGKKKKKKDDMLIECVCVCVCTFNVKGGIGFESSTAGITVNRTFDMERCCSNRENQRKDTEGECHQQQHPRCHEYFCIWLIVNKLMVVEQYLYCERTWAFADYIS